MLFPDQADIIFSNYYKQQKELPRTMRGSSFCQLRYVSLLTSSSAHHSE